MSTTIELPADLVEQHEDEFGDETAELAHDILEVWDPSASGKAPSGVAATAVYVAAMLTSETVTQGSLCDIFGTSPATIRKQQADAMKTAREENVL